MLRAGNNGSKRNRVDKYDPSPNETAKIRAELRARFVLSKFFIVATRRLDDSVLTTLNEARSRSFSFFFSLSLASRGRRMVQMVGMVGVRERLHAHEKEIVRRAATQPRRATLPG